MNLVSPSEGILVKITNNCNLNCKYCTLKKYSEPSENEILKNISALNPNSDILLCGGEPFVSKNIFKYISEIKRLNHNIGIITNGRIFIYPDLIKKISPPVDSIIISPFLPERKLYGRFTGYPEGFQQSIEGLKQLLYAKRLRVELRYPLCKETISSVAKIRKLLTGLPDNSNIYIVFSLFSPAKDLCKNLPAIITDYKPVFDELRNTYHIYFENFPYCLFNHIEHTDISRFQRHTGNTFCPLITDNLSYEKPLQCSECINDNICRGIPSGVFSPRDVQLLTPVRGVRSNSYDYIKIKDNLNIREPDRYCKIYTLYQFDKPLRYLFLKSKNNIALYHSDTSSFSDAEIKKTKLERVQLYIDDSKKTALDDFRSDIKQLKINSYCEKCKKSDICAAFFEVSEELPFEREERWLRQEIKRLAGRILDIGCGDMRFYKDIINKLLKEKKIEYWGIDISNKALKQLKKDIPGANTVKTTIEDFRFKKGYFDYLFLLRSLNHFYDMKKAFDNISGLVRNYGMIIVAECVPFALLRNQEKVKTVRSSRKPVFEHYRNWSSEDFIKFIRDSGYKFKIDTHKPVQSGTSNQWIVKLMKIE